MWIMTNKGFVSLVQHKDKPHLIVIRARTRDCLYNFLQGHTRTKDRRLYETLQADYRWRAFVPKDVVAQLVQRHVEEIDYTNFKNSVKDTSLHDAYLRVWGDMYELQVPFAGHYPAVERKPLGGRKFDKFLDDFYGTEEDPEWILPHWSTQ